MATIEDMAAVDVMIRKDHATLKMPTEAGS